MDLGIADHVVLVVGASRGLGFATAQVLAEEGAYVAGVGRYEETIASAMKQIGPNALPVRADVTMAEHCERAVAITVERFGALHHLVLNAGGPPPLPADAPSDEQWLAAFETNLLSAVRLTRAALPHLRAARGSVVAMTSYTVKEPVDGLVLSNAIRAGVVNWVRSMANELGPSGVRFNSIAPGRFATERVVQLDRDLASRTGTSEEAVRAGYEAAIPLRRYGDPVEFGRAVAFFLSEAATYFTGQCILVDGGITRTSW